MEMINMNEYSFTKEQVKKMTEEEKIETFIDIYETFKENQEYLNENWENTKILPFKKLVEKIQWQRNYIKSMEVLHENIYNDLYDTDYEKLPF